MVENRTIKYSGDDVTIGDVTRPTSEIVSIVASGSEIRVTFRTAPPTQAAPSGTCSRSVTSAPGRRSPSELPGTF